MSRWSVPWIVIQRLCESQMLAPSTPLPRIVSRTRWKWIAYLPSTPSFPEMPELGVADAARRAVVIHRVAAHAGGIGGLDDDVAREVGDLAAHQSLRRDAAC